MRDSSEGMVTIPKDEAVTGILEHGLKFEIALFNNQVLSYPLQ